MAGGALRTAVILAAGLGRRMWPYDELRPKATLPILNRPLIARLADDLAVVGVDRLVVVTGHQGQRIRYALSGVPGVAFVRQDGTAGTATALMTALPLVEDEQFLVLHGDLLLARHDLQALLSAFAAGEAPLAALVSPLEREDSRDWICATVRDGALTEIEGHARQGEYRLCGVYAMRRAALRYVEANPGILEQVPVGGMPPAEADLAASVAMLVESGESSVPAVIAQGPFVDLDKPWHILEANRRAIEIATRDLEGGVCAADGARISDGADIRGPVVLEAGASIGPRTLVEGPLWVGANTRIDNGPIIGAGVVIGAQCRIANYCQIGGGTTVGPLNVVDHCAELGGLTMDRVYLSHYMEISGVIGSATDLGAATVCGNLRFDDGQTVHRVLGRPEVPGIGANACYLGDYCRTGVNAILMPGVKIGPYCCIGPGVVVYEDVPGRTLLTVRQELVRKRWGPERYGW